MAAPELRLNVTLDLASFRSQLGKLAQTAATYYYPVNLIIDKKNFEAQLKALGKIKPVININDDQLIAARTRIGTLNKSLATLRRATATPIEIKVKYVETGKPPAGGTAEIGRAVSGGVRGSQAIEGFSKQQLQNTRKMMVTAGMAVGQMGNLAKATSEEYRKSIVQGFTNSGQEAINGFAAGLKDASSKIGAIAAKVGEEGVRGIKDALGIASPSRVFKQIGEFSVDGLELGFLNGLKDFKSKSVAEVKKIVALLRFELAKVSDISGPGGPSMGSLRRQLVGRRAYTSPIGPLPVGSEVPYARGDRGQFGSSGYEPRMVSSPAGRAYPAAPNSFLGFSRGTGGYAQATSQAPSRTPSSFLGFSQRAAQIQQGVGGGGSALPASIDTSATVGNIKSLMSAINDLGGKAAGAASQIKSKASRALRDVGDFISGEGRYDGGYGGGRIPPKSGGGPLPGGGGGGNPPAPPSGGGRGGGFFGGMQFNMPKLPGAGIVQGLGTEFAFAAKQVLLFGTAYKALAFLTDFPSKVGAAVGQLQSFRNTLSAISPTAADAAASNQLILDTVDKYNIPIQSARDGFTKLYASMEPAGFSGKQIGDLFLGISKASATLGLSSDKVDRVTYAFSQMASKGQLMSEEVSGQLGDVIPGALSIMAKAANMDIKTFKKAMEDGMFVGKAFEAVMSNVPIVLEERFGKGAEGAAKTFQGALNNMQTSLTLLYQAFEPVAVGFLNAVVMPMTSGIETLTEGLNAFFTGAATKTSGGFAIAQELEKLRPTFEGLRTNAVELIKVFGALANTVLTVGKLFLQLASNPFVGYIAKIAIIAVPLNATLSGMIGILTVMRGIWAANAIQLLLFNRGLVTGNITLSAFKAQMRATGATAAVTSASIRTAGITLRTFFAATGVGLVLVGISLLIERFLTMNQALADSKEKALGAAQAIRSMSQTEARQAENQASRDIKILQQLEKRAKKGEPIVKITEEEKAVLQRSGVSTGLFNPEYGKTARLFPEGPLSGLDGKSLGVEVSSLAGALQQADSRAKEAAYRIRAAKFDEQQVLTPPALQAIPGGGGEDDKATKIAEEKLAKSQDKLANRQDQLALEAANRQVALDQSTFDSRLRMSDAEYDHERALQDSYFERKMSGLDSIEARQKKFQQDLQAIENRRIDSIRKAELDAVKAVQDLRSASIKAAAVNGGAPGDSSKYVDRSVLRKYLESEGFSRTSGDFTNKGHKTPDHMLNAMDYGIMGGSDADALRKTIAMERKLKATGAFGDQLFGPERDPYGHGAGKGGQNIHLHIPTPDKKIKLTPGLSNLIGGEGLQSSAVGLNTRSGAFAMGRREDKLEGQLAVEQQDAQNKALEKLETIRRANNLALEQTITLVKQNIDSIFPAKEQQLENDLLEMRNNLELKGASKEIIDMEVQKYKAVKENAHNLQMLNEKIAKNNEELTKLKDKKITTEEEKEQIKFLTKQTAEYNIAIAGIPEQQRLFNEQLERTAALAVESPMVKLAKQLNETKKELIEIGSASSIAIGSAKSIGEAFGNSFKSMISGSATVQQSFASLFQSVGDYFLDMASRIISKYIEMQAIQGLMSIFNMFAPGAAAGGGFALGGPGGQGAAGSYGSAMSPTSSLPSFTGGAGFQPVSMGAFGIQQFASGGIVQGPTLGLVGEGKYNEAIIPLPDGKSVPVQLAGGSEGTSAPINTNIVVNVKNGQSDSQVTGNQGNQLGREIEGAVRQVILKEIRPGGIIYSSR